MVVQQTEYLAFFVASDSTRIMVDSAGQAAAKPIAYPSSPVPSKGIRKDLEPELGKKRYYSYFLQVVHLFGTQQWTSSPYPSGDHLKLFES
jgi:hypothetical protein